MYIVQRSMPYAYRHNADDDGACYICFNAVADDDQDHADDGR